MPKLFPCCYNFGTNTGDPAKPYLSGVIAQGRDGKLYSTTEFGGDNGGRQDGAMFSIAPSGALTVPYSFPLPFEDVVSGLTLGTDGQFLWQDRPGRHVSLRRHLQDHADRLSTESCSDFRGTWPFLPVEGEGFC